MDPDYGPFPDYESALNWLERRGNFVKGSWIVETFTPQEVARRVKVERLQDCARVFVRGYDTSLPETKIKDAIVNHFSSCGEIVELEIAPIGPGSNPDRFLVVNILGEDAKEKAEQLNGSDLGGCKLDVELDVELDVNVPICPGTLCGEVGERDRLPYRAGYVLPEHVRRRLDLKKEARMKKEERKRCSLKRKEKETLCEEETKPSSQKKLSKKKKLPSAF